MFLTLLAGTALSLQAAVQVAVRIPNLATPPKGDQVLAKVGNVAIRADDIAAVLWEARGEEILNDFVAYQLLKAQAEKQGVLVSDADVQRRMATLLKAQEADLPPGTDPQVSLNEQGLSASRLFLNVKTDLLLDGLAAQGFRPAEYVKVSTIIVTLKTEDPAEVEAAKNRLNKATARIKAGETWEAVAADTIEEPNAKKTGGYLGWRPLNLFPNALRSEISTLKPGQISGIAKTQFGVQMFRIEALGKDATGDQLEEMRTIGLRSAREQILQDVRANAKIERTWAAKPKS